MANKKLIIPKQSIEVNKGKWKSRILIGTPVTGLVRIEWVERRYSQILPTNWSLASHNEFITSAMPLRFQVSDAQNIIADRAINEDVEWLWLIEQDNVLPFDAFLRINKYMINKRYPVISGLYFTKGIPPEPIVYRGRGNGYFKDWKMGDMIWADGVPTGCILIHTSVLRAMWNDAPEYLMNGRKIRRIFEEPARVIFRSDVNAYIGETGTSDLAWCAAVMEGNYLEKAGWHEIAKKKYPFLVDTNMFCTHIDDQGRQFPLQIPPEYVNQPKEKKKVVKKEKLDNSLAKE
jgi:hypothetical protein